MNKLDEMIIKYICESKEQKLDFPINLETHLSEIGMSSLEFIKFVVAIEETLDIEFDDKVLADSYFVIVGDLVDYVSSKV